MDFMNRITEIDLVSDHLDRPGAGLFVLYGRRRIGKTALLQRVLVDRPGAAYHVGTRSTIAEEMARSMAIHAAAGAQYQHPSWRRKVIGQRGGQLIEISEGLSITCVAHDGAHPIAVGKDRQLGRWFPCGAHTHPRCVAKRDLGALNDLQ